MFTPTLVFMKKLFLLLSVCLSGYSLLHAQSPVSVNPVTGTATVSIPVMQISKGGVSIPISLNYSATGVKPKDVEGSGGIGWYLSAGGQVSRQLRGLPDDCQKDNLGNALLGWLNNTNGTNVSNFNISNDNSTSTCTDETTDINYINNNFTGYSDTEPDIFNVSAPGLSCQLVFDQSKKLQVLSAYQDLKINYQRDATSGQIISFTIINDKGTRYVFDVPESLTQTAVPPFPGAPVGYFANTYNQYLRGVSFYSNWYLSSITDINGNALSLSYTDGPSRPSSNPIELFIAGSNTKKTIYTMEQTAACKNLSSISNGKDQLTLTWISNTAGTTGSSAGGTNLSMISSVVGMGRNVQFNYSTAVFVRGDTLGYSRYFLRNVNESGCNSPVNYNFTYYGENPRGDGWYNTLLSDSSSTFTDYWGYQNTNNSTSKIPAVNVNPSNPAYPRYTNYNYPASVGPDYTYSLGSNGKYVDGTSIIYGSLSTITNANGGVTNIVYEPNDYLDVPSNSVFLGNGIRVKSITDNDGNGNNMIRNYSYLNPATGKSSGKPLTLPIYAFTIPYTGSATGKTYWDNATVISANDLSNDDHTIMYGYCKESKTGAGSTLYQYYIPATTWDNSAAPGCAGCSSAEWMRTLTNVARPTCVSYGPIINGVYIYPFTPVANYDMERGLIQKVTNYNDTGTEVNESVFTYQRTGAPTIIQGFKFEDNNGVKAYSKYNLYANTSELTSQVAKKIFDSSTLSQAQSGTTNYTYGNTYHQLIKQQVTNSDNSITAVNTTYTKDYAIANPGADSTVNAIYHLQNQNIDIPVETYTQVTRAGVTQTINAQLTKFKTITLPGNRYAYLPFQSLKYIAPDGGSFTPFSIAGGLATNDPKYLPSANYTTYSNNGVLQTADDNYRHVQTIITDQYSSSIVASFKNTAAAEIGYEDFDSSFPSGVNYVLSVPTGIVNTNSHAGNSYTFNTGQSISKAMARKVGEGYYILSAWISSSAAGNLGVTLTNSSNATSSYSEPFTNTGGISTYFEWKVPVGNMTPAFTMSLNTNQLVYIDDILFYPQSAEASTMTYDPVGHFKIAETNTNGVSAYYKNDQWGRLLFAYDQDKNIKEKKTYTTYGAQITQLPTPAIGANQNQPVLNTPVIFTVTNYSCITGVTYNWNFGDGTTASGAGSQQHTYSTAGSYTVTVTATHPQYGTATASKVYSTAYPALVPVMCQSGVTVWDNCNSPYKAIQQNDCGSNPNDNLHNYYTITGTGSGSGYGTLHYQWQVSYDNMVTWSNVGTDSPQLVMTYHNGTKQQAYIAQCIVTSSVGQTGTSNTNAFITQGCSQ